MQTTIMPNAPEGAATEQSAVPSLDSIAAKMTAMRESTLRNQLRATEPTATGADESAESSSPEAPSNYAEAEIDDIFAPEERTDNQEAAAPEQVSSDSNDSSAEDLIDFVDFADSNPNAKFKFTRNGKEIVIDARKAAAILGQGGAIHEEARQLKVHRAEFDEYVKETQARQEGLALAMEFTIEPRLQKAYDEIVKTQNYQTTFHNQMSQVQDPAQRARIQASMQQNEQYIRQQQQLIGQLKPAVEQFKQVRGQQVQERLQTARKSFTDKELKNEYVFNEVRDKVAKIWPQAQGQSIPGVANIDLISSDETLLSLIRDGLKYRDKPSTKSAGSSMAALTRARGGTTQKGSDDNISKLREQAKSGDKKAADNLLMAQLSKLRSARGGR